jgi:hypothetical protein
MVLPQAASSIPDLVNCPTCFDRSALDRNALRLAALHERSRHIVGAADAVEIILDIADHEINPVEVVEAPIAETVPHRMLRRCMASLAQLLLIGGKPITCAGAQRVPCGHKFGAFAAVRAIDAEDIDVEDLALSTGELRFAKACDCGFGCPSTRPQ